MYSSIKGSFTTSDLNNLVIHLQLAGFKKHAKAVAMKMLKSGRSMDNYSKLTGLLKKRKKCA